MLHHRGDHKQILQFPSSNSHQMLPLTCKQLKMQTVTEQMHILNVLCECCRGSF